MKVKEWVQLPDGMTLHTPRGIFKGICPKDLVPAHVKTTPLKSPAEAPKKPEVKKDK